MNDYLCAAQERGDELATKLAEALSTTLDLARSGALDDDQVFDDPSLADERKRQIEAINMVENLTLNKFSDDGLKLEMPRMLVLSTAHIRSETDTNLEMHTDDVPGTFYPKVAGLGGEQYGWFIPIDPETPWSHTVSADLVAIRKLALANGCTWIALDRDGPVVDGLPTYDW